MASSLASMVLLTQLDPSPDVRGEVAKDEGT